MADPGLRWLRRPCFARREVGRFAISTAHDLPARHQSQGRSIAWPRRATDVARHRRRGDRIRMIFAAVHESAYGTKETYQPRRRVSAVWGTQRTQGGRGVLRRSWPLRKSRLLTDLPAT